MEQMWQDGVTNTADNPVSLSEWNTGVKMVVNAWYGRRYYRVFDFANVGYQVSMPVVIVLEVGLLGSDFCLYNLESAAYVQ